MKTIAVIGGGAAGFMAAIAAAEARGPRPPEPVRIVLLERTADGGRKILISGGGRCNVLPSVLDPAHYVTDSSPNTLRKILLSWPLAEQRAFFERGLGIPLVREDETGKLFPASNRARDVRDALVAEARRLGVELLFEMSVEGMEPADPLGEGEAEISGAWNLRIIDRKDGGRSESVLRADAVIVATGGLSVPATGSDGTGHRLLAVLGHTLHPAYPALTPLLVDPPVHGGLAGVSLTVELLAEPSPDRGEGVGSVTGGFLFTHRGYSGPTVLNVSHLAIRSPERPRQIRVRWTGEGREVWDARLRNAAGGGSVGPLLRRHLPQRLADQLLAEAGVPSDRPLGQMSRGERETLLEKLSAYPLPWTGDEGYRKAEVTGGGVALSEVDPRTLESRVRPGLYLCGEVLDAFGPIGGYNFAWAWATGRLAGTGAVRGLTREPSPKPSPKPSTTPSP
jgi:predicted Rossmann fold flavoprotein